MTYQIDELKAMVDKYKYVKSVIMKRESGVEESTLDHWKELDPDSYRQWLEVNQYALSTGYYAMALYEGNQFINYRKAFNKYCKEHEDDVFWHKFKNIITDDRTKDALLYFDIKQEEFEERIPKDPDGAWEVVDVKEAERLDAAFGRLKNDAVADLAARQKYSKNLNIDEAIKITGGYFDELSLKYLQARTYVYSLSDPPDAMMNLVDSENQTISVKDELMNMVDANRHGTYLKSLILNALGDEYERLKKELPDLRDEKETLQDKDEGLPALRIEYADLESKIASKWAEYNELSQKWPETVANSNKWLGYVAKIRERENKDEKEVIDVVDKNVNINKKEGEMIESIKNMQIEGLTQTKMAEKLGITQATVSYYSKKIKELDKIVKKKVDTDAQ